MTVLLPRCALLLLLAGAAATCGAAAATKRPPRKPAAHAVLRVLPAIPPVDVASLQPGLLTSGQLDAAGRVFVGSAACRGGVAVQLQPLAQLPGRFELRFAGHAYLLVPQETSTGAVRLEDRGAGIVWLQIPAKSMLLDDRAGSRLADECQLAEQRDHAAAAGDALDIEARDAQSATVTARRCQALSGAALDCDGAVQASP